jgi:hypothetical protein
MDRNTVRLPANSITRDHGEVAIAGKIGDSIGVIVVRIVSDVLRRLRIALLKDTVAVGGPLIEIIGVGVAVNVDVLRNRGANVERVAAGQARFARGGIGGNLALENSDPAIALSGINANS